MSICSFPDLKGEQQALRKKMEAEVLVKFQCVYSDAVYLPSHWHKLLLEFMQSTDI